MTSAWSWSRVVVSPGCPERCSATWKFCARYASSSSVMACRARCASSAILGGAAVLQELGLIAG